MKILWFVNMPPNQFSVKIKNKVQNYQGWISGLAEAIRTFRPDIDLSIAFEADEDETVTENGVTYYAFSQPSRQLLQHVKKIVLKVNPDLIHLHGSEGPFPALPTEAWCNKPVCMSLQGIINGYFEHYLGGIHAPELECCTYAVKRIVLPFLKMRCSTSMSSAKQWRLNRAQLERKAFINVNNILGRTTWDRAWTNYLNPNATYFYAGEILRQPFYRGRRDAKKIVSHLIYASSCLSYPLKGGHWLFRAIANLKKKYPDVKLCVADSAYIAWPKQHIRHYFHSDYTIYLRKLATELGIWDNLILCPSLTAEEVVGKLSTAEVFCLPSTVENSPNSLGEAAIMGVPIVATNVGGVSSLVEHNQEALLVPSSDPAALAYSIEYLFENPTKAKKLADAAYLRSKQLYDQKCVVNQITSAYEQIITNH